MSRPVLVAAAIIASLASAGTSAAQPQWVVLYGRGADEWSAPPVRRLAVLLDARGERVIPVDVAVARLRDRAPRPASKLEPHQLEALRRSSGVLFMHAVHGRREAAAREARLLEETALPVLDAVNRDPEASRLLQDGLLHHVRVLDHARRSEEAREAMRHVIALVPDVGPNRDLHPPTVFALLAEVRADAHLRSSGTLRVEAEDGCLVRLNGRPQGRTQRSARTISPLSPGQYLLQVECDPSEPGPVHRVVIAAEPRTVRVDPRFDRALETFAGVGLRYASDSERDARLPAHVLLAAEIAGADRAIVVTSRGPGVWRLDRFDGLPSPVSSVLVAADGDLDRAVGALVAGESLSFLGPTPERIDPAAALAPPISRALSTAAPEDTPPAPDEGGPGAAGWLLGAGGVAGLGTAWALAALAEDPAEPTIAFSVAGGLLTTLALPLLLPEQRGIPFWTWIAAAGGVASSIVGSFLVAQHGDCKVYFESGDCKVRVNSGYGGVLYYSMALPLLTIPFVYLLRPTEVRSSVPVGRSTERRRP
jgi:hypothetical protein